MSKFTLKKALLLALFAVMFACCLMIGIAAAPADDAAAVTDGYVARTGEAGTDTYYKSLPEAISAAPENGTVTLIANTTLNASLNLTKSVTLAGKGVISTNGVHTIVLVGNVHLTVTGNAEIRATGASAIFQTAAWNTEVTLAGNAKVTSTDNWAINYKDNKTAGVTVKLHISDNAAVSGTYGVTVNHVFALKLTMTGGSITATGNDAIYIDSQDTAKYGNEISILGGTVTGKKYGMFIKNKTSATLTVDGGSITAGTNTVRCDSATTSTIHIKESDAAKKTTLSYTDAVSDYFAVFYLVDSSVVDLNISGGTFVPSGKGAIVYGSGNGKTTLTVSGGTVDGTPSFYCWNNGRILNVTLSGSFGTGAGQTGSFGTPANNLFNLTGGTADITSSASITSAKTIFYNKGGKQTIKITGGTLNVTGLIFNNNGGNAEIAISGGKLSSNERLMYTDSGVVTVTLSGSFTTYSSGGDALFCTSDNQKANTEGSVTYIVEGNITSAADIFRAQGGTQNVIINSGKIVCDRRIAYTTFTKISATTLTNVTVNGGELTTNNKSNMFVALAGTMNINFLGGIIKDGNYLVHYNHIETSGSENFSKGLTLINMASGYISTIKSVFVSDGSSEGNVRVVKGDIRCTTTDNEMYILARWGNPSTATGGTATSEIVVEGGNFSFTNAGKVLYTAVIGMKNSGTANVTVSGGMLDGGNYGIRTINSGNTLNLTITGGTITARYATTTEKNQGGSVLYSESANTVIKMSGGTLCRSKADTTSSVIGINIKKNVNATIEISGKALIDVTGNGIVSQTGDTGTAMKLTITGGTIKAGGNCVALGGVTRKVTGTDYTAVLNVTGGTFESTMYTFYLGFGNKTDAKNIKLTWGGTAKATTSNTTSGYFLVLNGNTLLDLDITGGTVYTARASIHLDSTVKPTAERPFPAIVKMSGGTVTSADVALNIKNTCLVDFTMTGGTLKNENSTTAVIRNDAVINADTDTLYASRITLSGSAAITGKGVGIWAQNGAMDITLKGIRVYELGNGLIRLGTSGNAASASCKSSYPSAIVVDGGYCIQTKEHGADAFCCYNKNATITIKHGFQTYNGRGMITNKGKGAASTLPGSSSGDIYSFGAPVVNPGASARLVAGSNGLRFISHIDAATVAQILSVADSGSVSYGTLIFPASYLDKATYYTHETIEKYLDIKAKDGLIEDGEGGYDIRAAIVNIKEANYGREFVAIAYAKYTSNGETYYRYSALQLLQTARSIRQIARMALLDTNTSKTGDYLYPTDANTYSRYTKAERDILLAYNPVLTSKTLDLFMIAGQSNGSGYSFATDEFKASNPNFTNGYSNILFSGLALSSHDNNDSRRHGTLLPTNLKAGFGQTNDYIGYELGLADMLSNAYNEKTGKTAAILKYADGGTMLSDNVNGSSARIGTWTPPSYTAEHGKSDEILSGNLYTNFVRLVEETVTYYRLNGYDVNVCGMFWMQGESECNYYSGIPKLGNDAAIKTPTEAQVNALYTNLFKALVSDARNDIGKAIGEDLSAMPVVAGSISESFGTIQSDNQTKFVKMQEEMVKAVPHAYLLRESRYLTTGTDSNDTAHYTADDVLFAGRKLGEMYLTLMGMEANIPAVKESDYVAEVFVNGASAGKYVNLAYAMNTAPKGATVKLLRDLTLYGPWNIATEHPVTFDGNGYTIHSYSRGHSMKVIGYKTNVTLNNIRLINHRDGVDNAYGIYMYKDATLNITGENTYIEAYRYGIVVNQVSTVNISGGTFTTRNGQNINSGAIYVGSSSTINISGGNFVGVNNGAAIYAAATYSQTVSGKTVNYDCEAKITITGGTFTPGKSATYAIYSNSVANTLSVSGGATVIKGKTGSVYNKNTTAGTKTY